MSAWIGPGLIGAAMPDGMARNATRGRHVQAARAVPEQPASVHERAEAGFRRPAAFERNKALAGGITIDHAVAPAVEIAPYPAAFGEEGAVQHRLTQARQAYLPGLSAPRQSRS
jgi:hypothetical protein